MSLDSQWESQAGFAQQGLSGRLLQRLTATIPLPYIPEGRLPSPINRIKFSVRPGRPHFLLYDIWIPQMPPLSVAITLISPDGRRISVKARV